jgi:hypothetical protein
MAEPTDNILSWTVTNWITVTLMAMIGFFLAGLAQTWWKKRNA